MKTLKIAREKVEYEIEDHFECTGLDEFIEKNTTQFDFMFEFKSEGYTYNVNCIYDIKEKYVYLDKWIEAELITFTGNVEVNLILVTKLNNPNSMSLDNKLNDIIEKRYEVDEENRRSAKDIEDTENYLRQQ